MKKLLLSLATIMACSSLSAKKVLTEIPAQYNIPEDGSVKAWDWMQADLQKGHEEINGTDTTWVTEYTYADASGFDYIVMSLSECTAGYKMIAISSDWSIKPEVTFSAGTTLAAFSLKDEVISTIANDMAALVIQPTSDGIMKISEIAYVSAEEYAEMKSADDAKERYMEKPSASNWKVEMDDNDASSWITPGWFGDEKLDVLYKTVVVEIASSSAPSRICIQTLPNYTVHEFFVAPTTTPVKVAYPITAEENGIGQIAVCNRNVTKFLVDSITGLLKEWTDPMSVLVNKIYYTSNVETSTFTETPQVKASWIAFGENDVCAAGSIAEKYTSPLTGFELTTTDTGSKLSIDSNTALFGQDGDTIASSSVKFEYRLKTGGKSSSSNKLSLSIPADGVLTIAVRTASSSAVDRTLVLKQDGEELFNDVILDGMAVSFKDSDDKNVTAYPMISVPVKAGTVEVTYPVGALNFYAFGFGYGYYVKAAEPEPDPDPTPDPTPDDGSGLVLFEGSAALSWDATNVSGAKLANVTAPVTFNITIETTTGEWWQFKFLDASWNPLNLGGKEFFTANDGAYNWAAGEYTYSLELNETQLAAAKGGMIVQGSINTGELLLKKVVAIESSTGINAIEANSTSEVITYNLAGQRASGKGLLIKSGKVILVK